MANHFRSEQRWIVFSSLRLLSLLLLTRFTTALPTNATDKLSLPLGVPIFISLGAPIPNCASLPEWADWFHASGEFDPGDCDRAINLFYNDYVKDHRGTRYEYLASGITPVHGIPTQRVPLKVGIGTCVVVVAMRNQFKEGELPAETPTRSAGSDISSFSQIYQGLQDIKSKCSSEKNEPGWYPLGDLNSIAVFIWQSASEINRRTISYRGVIDNVNITTLPEGRTTESNNPSLMDLLAAQQ